MESPMGNALDSIEAEKNRAGDLGTGTVNQAQSEREWPQHTPSYFSMKDENGSRSGNWERKHPAKQPKAGNPVPERRTCHLTPKGAFFGWCIQHRQELMEASFGYNIELMDQLWAELQALFPQ